MLYILGNPSYIVVHFGRDWTLIEKKMSSYALGSLSGLNKKTQQGHSAVYILKDFEIFRNFGNIFQAI